MPRAARIDSPDLLQHVIVRGVDRCSIFRDDDDRSRFLRNFSKLLVHSGTECLAWSLMTNHFHLLLRPHGTRLASLMRRMLTGYAIYFNMRHRRSGHLFQNRYTSIVCEEDSYLLELVRYIHLNPLRAGMIKEYDDLDSYAWSGHSVVLGKGALEGQAVDEVLALLGNKKPESMKRYRSFVADGVMIGKREELGSGRKMAGTVVPNGGDGEAYDQRILGSGAFVEQLRERQELGSQFPRKMAILEVVVRVCRYFGVDPQEVCRNGRAARIVEVRSAICYLAVRIHGHSGVEVGKLVNLQRAGVSIAAGRGEMMVKVDPNLLMLVNN